MGRTVFQLDSVASKQKILHNWDEEKDHCREGAAGNEGHTLDFGVFSYDHSRPLTNEAARKAHDYIRVLVKNYPFQIRYAMALPLWDRFCREWCDSGSETRALGAI